MDLPHNDEYWPGADHFVVSDSSDGLSTIFYPRGRDGITARFPSRVVVRYLASELHSAPGFCPAGADAEPRKVPTGSSSRGTVLRTFVRIMAWDPLWIVQRHPHFAALLGPAPEADWERPEICQAPDIIHGCFDPIHTCERCCDLSKGPMGDTVCWAGWMTYQKCCGPASRRWGGCGWRTGADLWAHDYYSLTPPRLHSAAQCQQRCEEDPDCGGFTYIPRGWNPTGCQLPLAAILSLRYTCLLRAGADLPPTPHRGMIWGPRDCEVGNPDDECFELGGDRLSYELEIRHNVPDALACRALCRERGACQAFAYYPHDYDGETRPGCILPTAVHAYWETRCLLKSVVTGGSEELFLPLGSAISGVRQCVPAAPWFEGASPSRRKGESVLAVDGNYSLEGCYTRGPWRFDFDAEYIVTGVVFWTGGVSDLHYRPLRRYVVSLVGVNGSASDEAICGTADETPAGRPSRVSCEPSASSARGLLVRAFAGTSKGIEEEVDFSLCEVELRVEPVPCTDLINEALLVGAWEVRIFNPGGARLLPTSSPAASACERRGGSLISVAARGDRAVCAEASCAPTACLEAFDTNIQAYADFSGFSVWDASIEKAADLCGQLDGPSGTGRFFEATVRVHEAATEDGGGGAVATMHFGFCAPGICIDDAAAAVASRIAGGKGVVPSQLPPGTTISIQNVRLFARWEDVDLDFLVAGFARSGTHSVQGNLAKHPACQVSREELTFNWGFLPMRAQIDGYNRIFQQDDVRDGTEPKGRLLRGGKGEGVVLSSRLLRLLARAPKLRLIVVVREPVEWLESIYNLRALGCRQQGHCPSIPTLDDVILNGASFEDVRVDYAEHSRAVEDAIRYFPPSSGRLLLLEFELLRARPQEFFDRICDFLGIAHFPANFSFDRYAQGDRKAYTADGTKADLCADSRLRPALTALKERLAGRDEHRRLAQLLATAGAPWVSSRLLLGRTHCD